MYTVSLIIPIYNVVNFIEESLLSALNQTYKHIEFILIDDCSTDDSMHIVNNVIRKHPRKKDVFIYKHDTNKGQSSARNTGLLKSHAKYVFFMDSDDKITPDCIKIHIETIELTGADFTVANHKNTGRKSIHNRTLRFKQKENNEILQSFLKREWTFSPWNKLVKRKLLIDNSLFFEGLYYEDYLWCFQLALCAKKLVSIDEETYYYLIRKHSITSSPNSIKNMESRINVIEKIALNIPKLNNTNVLRSNANSYITFLRFNTSLLLINTHDSMLIKMNTYNRINTNELKKYNDKSILSLLLKLPFPMFVLLLYLPYKIYKVTQTIVLQGFT